MNTFLKKVEIRHLPAKAMNTSFIPENVLKCKLFVCHEMTTETEQQ